MSHPRLTRTKSADGTKTMSTRQASTRMAGIARALIWMNAMTHAALAADAPPAPTYWTPEAQGSSIVHSNGTVEPMVLCMQGLKVVMQVQVEHNADVSYKARFFNVDQDLTKSAKAVATVGADSNPALTVDGRSLRFASPATVTFNGMLKAAYPESEGITLVRTLYPSTRNPLVIDEWQLRNVSDKPLKLDVSMPEKVEPYTQGTTLVHATAGPVSTIMQPGRAVLLVTSLLARSKDMADPQPVVDAAAEHAARCALNKAAWHGPGRLETPEPMLDAAFALQKLHVLECPVETVRGVITHNGSLTYSPGIWANDPVEYSSPLFPFFGDAGLNRAAINMYRVWLDHCKRNGITPFPGSFEGPGLKLTQHDRGDDAMVLYGLSKFLLFQGDRASAEEMWPLIEFAAASVLRHTTAEGIVASKTDEMEGRYPTNDANLSTSALAYGGYRFASRLARELHKSAAVTFDERASALRKAIESCYGAEVEGFHTYRYYKENTTLRGWILLPLAMGIDERRDGTLAALLSDKLWPRRNEGADILAESTRPTEWGRETYYALRVLFKAGSTEDAIDLTRRVVAAQIFGARGPYPDEDAIDMLCPGSLYPRVFTEGMFGIEPTGLASFECTPRLPAGWPRMALKDVRAFNRSWDLVVERNGELQNVTVRSGEKVLLEVSGKPGETYQVQFR